MQALRALRKYLPSDDRVFEVTVLGVSGLLISLSGLFIAILLYKERQDERQLLERLVKIQLDIQKSAERQVSADVTTALFPYIGCDAKQESRERAYFLLKKHAPEHLEDLIKDLKKCGFTDQEALAWQHSLETDSKGLANEVEFIRLVYAGRQYYEDGHSEQAAIIWDQARNIVPEAFLKVSETFPKGFVKRDELDQASEALTRKKALLAADLFRSAYVNIRAQ